MSRRLPISRIAFAIVVLMGIALAIVVLMGPFAFLKMLTPAAFSQNDSEKTKAVLKERDRLWDQSQKLRDAGKLAEATAAAEAALAIDRKTQPAGHADLVVSLDLLAGLYLQREDFAAAKAARMEALEILRKRHGAAHWRVTDARLALEDVQRRAGMTHYQRQELAEVDRLGKEVTALDRTGNKGEAVKAARRVLALRKEVLGERHPDYATSLSDLAALLKAQGDYAAARPLFEQALAIRKQVLGVRHPYYAAGLNNLALLLDSQGDYAAARPLYEQALAINKEVLGERHADYATSLNNLASLLEAQGDYAAARPLYEQALAIYEEVLGERHPQYAAGLDNLASLLWAQAFYAAGLNNLASLLWAQGDYAGARPLVEQALAIRKELLGERHPDYAKSLNNLAMLLKSQGDYAAARPRFEQALAIYKEVLGEHNRDYATSLNNLALLLYETRDYAAARPLYEQALAIRKVVLGERHPDYADSLDNLALLLWRRGTTPQPGPSTSRPWRSTRRCWASATPNTPGACRTWRSCSGATGLSRGRTALRAGPGDLRAQPRPGRRRPIRAPATGHDPKSPPGARFLSVAATAGQARRGVRLYPRDGGQGGRLRAPAADADSAPNAHDRSPIRGRPALRRVRSDRRAAGHVGPGHARSQAGRRLAG